MTTTKLRSFWTARCCALLLFVPLMLVSCGDDDGDVGPIDEPRPDGGRDRPDAGMQRPDAGMQQPDAGDGMQVTEVACPASPAATVDMDDLQFLPETSNVSAGDVVRWTNSDTVPHTVTSGDPDDADAGSLFDSGTLNPGDDYCLRFDSTGDFEYYCEIHPVQMDDGLVTVQ